MFVLEGLLWLIALLALGLNSALLSAEYALAVRVIAEWLLANMAAALGLGVIVRNERGTRGIRLVCFAAIIILGVLLALVMTPADPFSFLLCATGQIIFIVAAFGAGFVRFLRGRLPASS